MPTKPDITGEYLISLYTSEPDIVRLAARVGISRSAVSRRMRAVDADYARKAWRWSPCRKRAFVAYLKGSTLREVARDFKVGLGTVQKWFVGIHEDYYRLSRQGALVSTSSWLRANPEKVSEVKEVERWLINELPRIIESEANSLRVSFSETEERAISMREARRKW